MNKIMKWLAIFAMPHAFVVISFLIMLFTGAVSPSISSFAVDSLDNLYVGANREIQIFRDGVMIDSISHKASLNYAFTITEDNTILFATPSRTYQMDLTGEILETKEDLSASTYARLERNKRTFISQSGDSYRMIGILGRTRIVKNDEEVVYAISWLSYIMKILVSICVVSLFLNTPLLVFHIRNDSCSKNSG